MGDLRIEHEQILFSSAIVLTVKMHQFLTMNRANQKSRKFHSGVCGKHMVNEDGLVYKQHFKADKE